MTKLNLQKRGLGGTPSITGVLSVVTHPTGPDTGESEMAAGEAEPGNPDRVTLED